MIALMYYASIVIRIILVLLIVLLTSLYLYLKWNKYEYWEKRGIPHARPVALFGNLTFLMRKSFCEYFLELSKKFPQDYCGIFLAHKPALVVQSPELTRKILVKDADYFVDRFLRGEPSDPIGSLNLFTVKDPIWSVMRRECSPMFTASRLKMLTELMNINAQELVKRIQRDHIIKQDAVNLKELFTMYTSDTVAYTVFGQRMSALSGVACPLWFITNNMVKWTFWRGFEFTMIFFVPLMARIMRLKLFSEVANEYVKKLFWKVVNERKITGQNNDKDLVNLLLQIKENMKLPSGGDEELANNLMVAQAAIFILGAVETSSTTLSYCLMELAANPEKQDKLYEELRKTAEKTGKQYFEYEELLQLKYLTSCMQETLRKYPPVVNLDRICTKQYKLDDNLTIEEGTPVYVNIVGIHHNELHYPEPELWLPERFSGDNDTENRQFTYLPFGDGPRFCIGKRYGMIQIRAALSQIILNYKIKPVHKNVGDIRLDPYSVIISPADGGRVIFETRK